MVEAADFLAVGCRCFGAEVGHAVNVEDRLKKLSDQVDELKSLKKDVQKVVDDAPKADRQPTEVARDWLKRADSIIPRADSAMEKAEEEKKKYEQAGGGLWCRPDGWWSRYKLAKRIAKVTKEVLRHEGKGKELKILHDERANNAAAHKENATQAAANQSEHAREEKATAAT